MSEYSERSSEIKNDETKVKKHGKVVGCLKDNLFMLLVLLGVAIGFGIGFGLQSISPNEEAITWVEMPGEIYIRLLELTILPLIASNLIVVISSLNPKEQGKSSLIAFAYIMGYNILGAAIGTVLGAVIKPGNNFNVNLPAVEEDDPALRPTTSDVFADLILNLAPDNIIGMCLYSAKTFYHYDANNKSKIVRSVGTIPSNNLIGILLVSIAFGLSARAAGEAGKPFLDFFKSLANVVLKLVRAFLKTTPVGVCFMIAGAVMQIQNVSSTFQALGIFIVTITAGTGILFLLTLLIYFLVTFKNPLKFLRHTISAWLISFATTSPVVALPEALEGCDNFGVDPAVSRFVCPLAFALKADGPALFITCSCMFVAQTENSGNNPVTAVVIWILASVSALAIPNVPSASIIIVITILSSAGVPTRNTAYLYTIDWLLDRMRSGQDLISTMFNATVVDAFAKRSHRRKESLTLVDVATG